MQEAGADAILELAFTIADGLEYCRTGGYSLLWWCWNDTEIRTTTYQGVSNGVTSFLYWPVDILVGNKIVDHSDVVGASPVGAAPTTSSFST